MISTRGVWAQSRAWKREKGIEVEGMERDEEICCDELAREYREGTVEVDEQGSINVVDKESGRILIYSLRVCFFCGEGIAE